MKGPYERAKYDLRRVWECPKCHARTRTDGQATSRWCRCGQADQAAQLTPMRLVGDGVRRNIVAQREGVSDAGTTS